jgi:hypothetical protein
VRAKWPTYVYARNLHVSLGVHKYEVAVFDEGIDQTPDVSTFVCADRYSRLGCGPSSLSTCMHAAYICNMLLLLLPAEDASLESTRRRLRVLDEGGGVADQVA